MRAVHLTAFGNPVECLEFVQIQEPPAPSLGQVLIGVEFSPINLSDLLVVRGTYPLRPSLPSVIGNEGVGRILAVGPGVENVTVGDRVLTPLYGFAWAERIVVPAEGLFALPADVDPQQLAMLTINPPTAALLLSEFVDLAPGDWVVQNAANSGVGRAVIAFAKALGFKTINLVRRPELIDELKALGGDLVIVDTPEGLNLVKAALGTAAPRLAIDGVGGPSAATLINLLGRDGTVVAYAALGEAPIPISAIALIFKRISVRGFFLSDPEHAAKIRPVVVEAAELLRSGRLYAPVAATYPLSAIKDAVAPWNAAARCCSTWALAEHALGREGDRHGRPLPSTLSMFNLSRCACPLQRAACPKLTVCNREGFRTPLGVRKSPKNEPAGSGRRLMGI
jgi:NADPH:quinone reductase-like Zn-dependent oxidoreductase